MAFGRKNRNEGRPLWADLDAQAKADAADSFLAHLVDVTTAAHMDGSEEAKNDAVRHLATDLQANERGLLEAALGKAAMLEGHARAEHIRAEAATFLDGLRSIFEGVVPEDITGDGPQAGQERPTDLLPDEEAPTAPEAVSEAQEAAEKVWPEDRR